jgi:hypothetical protein
VIGSTELTRTASEAPPRRDRARSPYLSSAGRTYPPLAVSSLDLPSTSSPPDWSQRLIETAASMSLN